MKVLHISGARSWGGNEQQLIDMIPELQKLGVANTVFGMPDTLLEQKCSEMGIAFIAARDKKLNKFANYKYLARLVKQHLPDAIHLHTSDSLTVFTLSDMLFGLKTKAVFSKKGIGGSSSFLSKIKYNYKNVAYIICVSDAVRKSFKSMLHARNQDKMVVVYDGINLARLSRVNSDSIRKKFAIPEPKKLIGNIANHVAAKDLLTLVRAMSHLVHELGITDAHLIQIGKHSKLTPDLQRAIHQYNVADWFTLAGFQENASGYLPQFDLYVMSSQREGLPLTIYEAFEKEIPVVSTMAGGVPEVITDGENGYICPVGDFEQLALKMKKLLGDTQTQKTFAARSRDLLYANYTARHAAENTAELYKKLSR